jgi:hypothetical protein
MTIFLSILFGIVVYFALYKTLFDDEEDFFVQLKSLLAWFPITLLLDYDFSDATWRIWVWLPSGAVIGVFLFALLR